MNPRDVRGAALDVVCPKGNGRLTADLVFSTGSVEESNALIEVVLRLLHNRGVEKRSLASHVWAVLTAAPRHCDACPNPVYGDDTHCSQCFRALVGY